MKINSSDVPLGRKIFILLFFASSPAAIIAISSRKEIVFPLALGMLIGAFFLGKYYGKQKSGDDY